MYATLLFFTRVAIKLSKSKLSEKSGSTDMNNTSTSGGSDDGGKTWGEAKMDGSDKDSGGMKRGSSDDGSKSDKAIAESVKIKRRTPNAGLTAFLMTTSAEGVNAAEGGDFSKAAQHLEFLHGAFRSECFYWELVETSRRLVLTAVLSVIVPGRTEQILFAILVELVYLRLTTYFRPYWSHADDVISEVAHYETSLPSLPPPPPPRRSLTL